MTDYSNEEPPSSLEDFSLLTISAVCKMTGLSSSKLRRDIRDRRLTAYKFGGRLRIRMADLVSYINDHRNTR